MERKRLDGLLAIQRACIASKGDLHAAMAAIVSEYSVAPQSNGIVIELRDGDQLYYAAASGTSATMLGMRIPINASLSGMCVLTGEPLMCQDSACDPRVNAQATVKVGLKSMIVVPIPHRGQVVGVLKYHSDLVNAFNDEDMMMAHLVVGPIVVCLSSAAEEDAIKAKIELAEIIRLKNELVSNVSHELRTPLTSIAGALRLIETGAVGDLTPPIEKLVGIASRNSTRLRALVDDLLTMEKLESHMMEFDRSRIELGALVQAIVMQNEIFASDLGVRLSFQSPGAPIFVETDPARLNQVVTNLLSNAAKFSPTGSEVRVIVDRDAVHARIRVEDDGPGIPQNFRRRLFDRFAQSEQTRQLTNQPGTGLGLAISKNMVEQLGGTITHDEVYDSGAAFEICLPLNLQESAVAKEDACRRMAI